jgi:Rieske Fe-S protein
MLARQSGNLETITAEIHPLESSRTNLLGKGSVTKTEARTGLGRIQRLIGAAFLASAVAGVYLLATDNSLWLLAVSHAVGLVAIVLLELVLGVLNLWSVRRVYLPSLASALLAILLQVGDVFTAPQYGMTTQYFASYLFKLWAFDLLLALQAVVLLAGISGRSYALHLSRRRTRLGAELSYSRRSFLRSIVLFAGAVAGAVLLGSVKLPPASSSSSSSQQTVTASSNAPIANMKDLVVDTPVSFEYPAGYPNILLKNSDGSLTALNMQCTHVCCQCYWDSTQKVIYCPCHGSVFDSTGQVVRGPASAPLPSIKLQQDSSGNIFPTGVNGSSPCFG